MLAFCAILIAGDKQMLEKVSCLLADGLIRRSTAKERDRELYVYGFMVTLSTLFMMVSILLIGAVFFDFFSAALYLLVFTSLRVCSGGYHCGTYGGCFAVSNLAYDSVMLVSECILRLREPRWVLVGLLLLSALYILCNTPVLHPNCPIGPNRVYKSRRMSVGLTVFFSLLILLGMALLPDVPPARRCLCVAALTVTLVFIFMAIAKVHRKGVHRHV